MTTKLELINDIPQFEAIIKNNILPHYNLQNASIEEIKIKNTEKQRAVYKITNKDKQFCLKKVYYNETDLLFVYSAMEWLHRNGVYVPRLLPTVNKNRYVNYNDMIFVLSPWVHGEKCDFDNIENVINSSNNLGLMHKVSSNFVPIPGSNIRKGYDNIYLSVTKHLQKLLTCANSAYISKDKFSKLFLNNFEKNLYLAKYSMELASSIDFHNLSKTLCHGDYVNKNILFEDNKIWVIDFDKCSYNYSAYDISYFLRRLLKRSNTKWDVEVALSVLAAYRQQCDLTIDDLKYIMVYLAFPQKFWRISKDYYNNIEKCNKASFLNMLKGTVMKTDDQIEFVHIMENEIFKK